MDQRVLHEGEMGAALDEILAIASELLKKDLPADYQEREKRTAELAKYRHDVRTVTIPSPEPGESV